MKSVQGRGAERTFLVGTLSYNRAGLAVLFGWLLWGDFIFSFMEGVMPALLPILLKEHGATNKEIVIIVSTIFMVMNAALNPVISYQSDRFRSRWGRRRPFIFVTAPFVAFFLVLIPFGPDIAQKLATSEVIAEWFSWSGVSPVILVCGGLVVGFQAFNMFIASVYYYLIPDVVPKDHLGRFYGLFRICGALAGVFFNYFVFGLAETHFKEIFGITAIAYVTVISLMCWRVKEGEYPPPIDERSGRWWDGIYNYAKQCFGRPINWLIFLAYSSLTWAWASRIFAVFFYREELGFSLDLIGKAEALGGVLFALFAYPFGVVLDRCNAHKVFISCLAVEAGLSLLAFWFAVDQTSGVVFAVLRGCCFWLCGLATLKWLVEVYPSERYGQFASAGALFSSVGGIFLGPLCGWLMDWAKLYRYFLLWDVLFSVIGLAAAGAVYLNIVRSPNFRPPDAVEK